MDSEEHILPKIVGATNELGVKRANGLPEGVRSWLTSNEAMREIQEKGMREIEPGLMQFDHGFVLGYAGGRVVLMRTREDELDFPEVEKCATGAMLPTPYRYKIFHQTTYYDAKRYIRGKIGAFPERKKYFDMISKQHGLSPESVDGLPEVLYHSAQIVLTGGNKVGELTIDQLERLQEVGLLGGESPDRKFYLSTSRFIAFYHGIIGKEDREAHDRRAAEGYENARKIMLITVDPRKLAEYRNVYIDEESLERDDEYKKNFVVVGGLPGRTITRIEIFDQLEVARE